MPEQPEEPGLPVAEVGLWPLKPGIMVHADFTADEVAGSDTVAELRREITAGVDHLLGIGAVDPRCIHVLDKGFDEANGVHRYIASFHPDPTCQAEMRGGPVDGTTIEVDEHNDRGIPAETLRVQVPPGGTAEYELVGFRHDPPVWVYDFTS